MEQVFNELFLSRNLFKGFAKCLSLMKIHDESNLRWYAPLLERILWWIFALRHSLMNVFFDKCAKQDQLFLARNLFNEDFYLCQMSFLEWKYILISNLWWYSSLHERILWWILDLMAFFDECFILMNIKKGAVLQWDVPIRESLQWKIPTLLHVFSLMKRYWKQS